jgi:DNA-binding CsgD family transcriptional regulator
MDAAFSLVLVVSIRLTAYLGSMVSSLRSADLRAVVELVGEMDELDSEEAFPTHLLGRLATEIRTDCACFVEWDVVTRQLIARSGWWVDDDDGGSVEDDDKDEIESPGSLDVAQVMLHHPVCIHRSRTSYLGALTLSDFYPRRARVRHHVFAGEYHAHWNVVDSIEARVAQSSALIASLWFETAKRDFSVRDRGVLDVLQPRLAARHRQARVQRVLHGALSVLETRPDDRDAAVLLVAPGGGLEFASRSALELLVRYFGEATAQLPSTLERWRRAASGAPLTVRRDGHRLVVDVVGPGRSALVLHEEVASAAALTPREWEVMRCVGAGKTNEEIAELLWITSSTVKKHLEHVYAKLGVRTRTAALAKLRPRLTSGPSAGPDAAVER